MSERPKSGFCYGARTPTISAWTPSPEFIAAQRAAERGPPAPQTFGLDLGLLKNCSERVRAVLKRAQKQREGTKKMDKIPTTKSIDAQIDAKRRDLRAAKIRLERFNALIAAATASETAAKSLGLDALERASAGEDNDAARTLNRAGAAAQAAAVARQSTSAVEQEIAALESEIAGLIDDRRKIAAAIFFKEGEKLGRKYRDLAADLQEVVAEIRGFEIALQEIDPARQVSHPDSTMMLPKFNFESLKIGALGASAIYETHSNFDKVRKFSKIWAAQADQLVGGAA